MTAIVIDEEFDRDFAGDDGSPAAPGSEFELHLDLDGFEGPIDVLLTLARATNERYWSASSRIEIFLRSTFWSRARVSRTSSGPS